MARLSTGAGRAGEARDLDAVAFVRAAGDDLAQENDVVAPLAHGDVVVLRRGQEAGELGQFVIMRGEERAGAQRGVEIFRDRPRDAQAVEGARAAADFVEDDEAAVGRVVEDVRGLVHLDHEGALAAAEIVAGADARENAVEQSDHRALGRHEAAAMGQQRDDRDLPDVGALARHVGTGEDDEPLGVDVEPYVVGHEFLAGVELLEHGMPRFLEQERAVAVDLGLEVIALLRQRAPAEQHVDFVNGARGILDRAQVRRGCRAQVEEELVLELARAFLRAEDFRFHLLELGRDEALGVGHGLLARVVGGHGGEVGRADLDVVAEDLVVAHLERLDAGALLLAALQVGQPRLALDRRGAQFLQRGVVAGADEAALLELDGWVVGQRAGRRDRPAPAAA